MNHASTVSINPVLVRLNRDRRHRSVGVFAAWLVILSLVFFSLDYLNVPVERIFGVFGRIGEVVADRYYPPDIRYILDKTYFSYVLGTIQMAFLGALIGILLSIPLAWFASWNMTPSRRLVYPLARFVSMGCRAIHETIWTILLVSILGYGMFPGVVALIFFSVGFAVKLMAEEIEAIDMGPVEAMVATGANLFQVVMFGVLPQVRVALTGIAIYTWDVAFRAATVVGFFGAGGMGWYLKRNVLQIESQRVAAIMLSIVVLVLISEAVSAWARKAVMKMQ